MCRRWIVVGLLSIVGSQSGLAQTALPPEFASCARIKQNSERLACYDRAVDYLRQPAPASASAPSPENAFGLQASTIAPVSPANEAAEKAPEQGELSSISAKITQLDSDRERRLTITLDNGQTWRETTASNALLKTGDAVTINRAAFGSFLMSVPNGRSLRVRRIK